MTDSKFECFEKLAAPEAGFKVGPDGGLFASQPFPANSFVLECKGKLLDWKEAETALKTVIELPYDALSDIFFFKFDCGILGIDVLQNKTSLCKFINHSTDANLTVKALWEDAYAHLCFFSSRDIAVSEELTYNFGDVESPDLLLSDAPQNENFCEGPPKCPICLDFVAKDSQILPCNHLFCKVCIIEWLGLRDTCPVCRADPQAFF